MNAKKITTALLSVLAVMALLAAGSASAAMHGGKAGQHVKVAHKASAAKIVASKGHLSTGPIRVVVSVALDSGTWAQGGDDEGCQVDVNNANSWQQYGDELAESGDKAGAHKAYENASSIAGQANHDGCTIFLMD